MATEYITIVDENDNVIGKKERSEVTPKDIYRISCLWVTNNKGEVLLAKRALTKKNDPGKWGPSVVGTVSYNETYDEVAKREAMEEIGLSSLKLKKLKKFYIDSAWRFFVQNYEVQIENGIEFILQPEELDEVKWFPKNGLEHYIVEHPKEFTQNMPDAVRGYLY